MLAVSVFMTGFVACDNDDDDDEVPVVETQLPQNAKTFISQYYPDAKIASITRDTGDNEYNVLFTNGHDVTFNAAGEWVDVDAPMGQVIPDGIAPVAIVDYVSQNYSGTGINEISKEAYGYEVELTTGLDLEFNANGDFIRIDY